MSETIVWTCAEGGCVESVLPGSDWCAAHRPRCEACGVPVADGEDCCEQHVDPEADPHDSYRGRDRLRMAPER